MRLIIPLLFLTLVLNALPSNAAPTTKTTTPSLPLSAQPDPLLTDNGFHLTKLPTTQWSLSLGYAGGNFLESDTWTQGVTMSLKYSPLPIDSLPVWDLEAEINKNNTLGAFIGKRWYISDDDYQPYFRLAGGSFFDASSELGNLVQIKRWRARSSVGIGEQLNFEFGFGLAVTGPDLFAQMGYNFKF